jgi:glutamate-1-semialdehyde aminotransferase
MATAILDTATLVQMDIDHMLHPVTNLHQHAKSGPLVLARGEGSRIYDSDGKEYIDAFAGLWNVNVGHGRAELAEAAREPNVLRPGDAARHPARGEAGRDVSRLDQPLSVHVWRRRVE